MKKINLMLCASICLLWAVIGCSKNTNGTDVVESQTTIDLNINFPKYQETKATDDTNAIIEEAEVKTVDVFIFNSSGLFVSLTQLVAADFTQGTGPGNNDKYVSNVAISTTTGTKTVLVGVNLPASLTAQVKEMAISDMRTKIMTLNREDAANITKRLPMFSTEEVTQNVAKNHALPSNKFNITVQRFVSKVIVETSAALTTTGTVGTMGPMEFAISNFNTKLFMIQTTDAKDPNWLDASYVAGDFKNAVPADFVTVLDRAAVSSPSISDYKACYAMENSSEKKRSKEISRATVRTQFLPSSAHSYSSGTLTTVPPGAMGDTYWTVTPSMGAGTKFFFNKTHATDYANDEGGDVLEYTDGYNYWAIFFNEKHPSQQWDNLRNNMFHCTITKITLPGNNTDNPKNPEIVPSEKTDIEATVNIKPWDTPVLSDHELDKW